ncbi:uncharacterized protein Triagg1_5591 [Trichoderma aggressivum f. europaeum]|uniref:NADP-dependent oxidoreductase domain-containing protein n=1 Tax=Trichoderma aggressivum f. europaeum TaxID=173218 RepID=A0AAE1M4Q2_9HYPO|nr:hypothetical protein Triagg1_5591 [Trichoderma aggressivum f. europaeum]
MAIAQQGGVSTAHVNMMTDTIIANLPADGLRVVMRALLVLFPEITRAFECETKKFVEQRAISSIIGKDKKASLAELKRTQQIARSMLGCGLSFESLQLFQNLVAQGTILISRTSDDSQYELFTFLTSVDGDIVQAMTAVQKSLFIDTGTRVMDNGEHALVEALYQSLTSCYATLKTTEHDYPFGRSLISTAGILGLPRPTLLDAHQDLGKQTSMIPLPQQARETFLLNGRTVPRIFSGLWQMSSPAWGAASSSKIVEQFSSHVRQGFTAFDMADHYGDAEVIFFSLVDSRPVFEMGCACEEHNIKLLTYGTLCGGFLADKWLGKPEPDIYDGSITPSQRKYFEMIRSWGGWSLFQELLTVLRVIATKHQVDISNVATRWVLDFPYVGAVIVGARMGISEHTDENLSSFGWSLDQSDRESIEEILIRSRRAEIFQKSQSNAVPET